MIWGKIVNGVLFTADNVLITDTEQIFNAPAELWLEHGWKKIVEEPCPGPDSIPIFIEGVDTITVKWE